MSEARETPSRPGNGRVFGGLLVSLVASLFALVLACAWLVVAVLAMILSLTRADTSQLARIRTKLAAYIGRLLRRSARTGATVARSAQEQWNDPGRIAKRAERLRERGRSAIDRTQQAILRVSGMEHTRTQDQLMVMLAERVRHLEALLQELTQYGRTVSEQKLDEDEAWLDRLDADLLRVEHSTGTH